MRSSQRTPACDQVLLLYAQGLQACSKTWRSHPGSPDHLADSVQCAGNSWQLNVDVQPDTGAQAPHPTKAPEPKELQPAQTIAPKINSAPPLPSEPSAPSTPANIPSAGVCSRACSCLPLRC